MLRGQMATRRVRMPAAERRSALLAATLDVMGARGYHGTSLDEIAKAAGVSKALIYEHFGSKREMYGALVTEHVTPLFDALQANTERGGTGSERLRGGIDAFFGWVEDHRQAYKVFIRDIADPELAEALRPVQGKSLGVVAALMGTEPGDRRVVLLATQLFGALQALAAWWEDHPDLPREELVDSAMAFCWTGLERLRDTE